MAINILGIILLCVFYVIILAVGILAGKSRFRDVEGRHSELSVVAGRQLHGIVGILTMIATAVGGGFINGTAESIATYGLAWTISPFAIFVGLVLGGVFYAGRMRRRCYLTMLEPIQERSGRVTTLLVYLASLCGDLCWTASILNALGTSLSVVIGLDVMVAILVSASVTVLYTMVGQMLAVAYTDVVQLFFIVFGLVLAIPFVAANDHVAPFTSTSASWLGSISTSHAVAWTDLALAMILGTIPWQSYFQRVLSVQSATQARVLSVLGGLGALALCVPPILLGAYSTAADWSNSTLTGGLDPVSANKSIMILPLMLHEFTPTPVALVGLSAVSAAVMSSMDSSVLGSSSMLTHNVYRAILRQKASDTELLWVQRVAIFLIGAGATAIAIFVPTVWGLFVLAADIVYVIVLPQLTCALFVPGTNGYGGVLAFIAGVVLRLGAGEATVNFDPFIYYPFYDYSKKEQLFPFRTFAMLVSAVVLVAVSYFFKLLFHKGCLPERVDVLGAVRTRQEAEIVGAKGRRGRSGVPADVIRFTESSNAKYSPTAEEFFMHTTET